MRKHLKGLITLALVICLSVASSVTTLADTDIYTKEDIQRVGLERTKNPKGQGYGDVLRHDGKYQLVNDMLVIVDEQYVSAYMCGEFTSRLAYELANEPYVPAGGHEDYHFYTMKKKDEAVEAVKEYLNSFDWRNADEYTRAYMAASKVAEARYGGVTRNGGRDGGPVNNLVEKECMCQSFCDTYYMLCRLTGLDVVKTDWGNHTWNYVKIDGVWYMFDGTLVCANRSDFTDKPETIEYLLTTPETENPNWSSDGMTMDQMFKVNFYSDEAIAALHQ